MASMALWMAPPAGAQRYTFSTYGMASGLSNLNVNNLIEDHTGLVWVGTESGVFTADGMRFQKQQAFSDAGLEFIRALHEDGAGRIWAMDNHNLVYWEHGIVHPIAPELWMSHRNAAAATMVNLEEMDIISVPGEPDGVYLLRGGELLRIASQDHGRSWLVSSALKPALVAQHPELQELSSVAGDGASILWAGCGHALCRLDLLQGTVKTFGASDGVKPDIWQRLLLTRTGSIWARGEKHVLMRAAGATRFTEAAGLPPGSYLNVQSAAMVEDPDGNIVLNLAQGVARTSGSAWRVYNHNNGLPEDEINTLMIDHSGSLWLAATGYGILHWRGYGNWAGWTRADGLSSNTVWSAAGDRTGHLWVATETNLDRLDPGTNRIVPSGTQLPFRRLRTAIVDPRQHVWTGGAQGDVIDFEPGTGRARVAAAHLGRIYKFLIDKQQRIWVCSRRGLRFFSPVDGWMEPHSIDEKDIPQGYAWAIAESRNGTIWVTTNRGLFRLEGNTWTAIDIPFKSGKDYDFMIAAASDGTLWAQSKKPFPILHLKVAGNSATVIDKVSSATVGSENISFIATDQRGWLWVGSDDGVQVFNGKRWVHCASEDGLLWDDLDSNGFFADPDGSIWIGTSGGLSHLLHPESLFSEASPQVRLAYARLGDTPLKEAANADFDLRRPTLTVNILNTNYSRGSAVVYRYKLDGQENEWQETESGSLRFPALSSGSYKLTLFAYDRRLHEGSAPLSFSFKVLEPWWNRSWFRLLEGLGIVLFLIGLRHFSVHLLVVRQQELQSLVASRTEELEKEKIELLSTRSALVEMTRRDTLTGLLNRGAIFERMTELCENALKTGEPLAVAMADLDSFKRINDRYGHLVGDTVLRECAARVSRAVRPGDSVGRYGGEELLILMPGLEPASATARMEELRLAIAAQPICHGELRLTVTCSFGVAWCGVQPASVESLVSLADAALYLAKENGRNRVEYALRDVVGEEELAAV